MRIGSTVLLLAILLLGSSVAAPPASNMDQALVLIQRAKAAYAKISDYECMLLKREKLAEGLSPNHLIQLKVRTAPFCVSMTWVEPKPCAGQEVCFATGKNDGKMRVKPAGLLGAVGSVSVALDDARVRKTSRHSIAQAGIGNVIDMASRGWPLEKDWGLTEVKLAGAVFAKRKCTRVEMIHPTRADGKFLHHKNVIYFDQENGLPIRVENYDWPTKPGQEPELLEVFSYVNLKLNAGVPASTFER
jgi:hypothetical protein